MSRAKTRPDTDNNPGHITAEAYRKLEEETHYLWNVEPPEMAKAVAVAAAQGDRSENAEVIYNKNKLMQIDRRLQFLGKRLDVLEMVDTNPKDYGRVYFGCWAELEDEQGEITRYRVVGPDETLEVRKLPVTENIEGYQNAPLPVWF